MMSAAAAGRSTAETDGGDAEIENVFHGTDLGARTGRLDRAQALDVVARLLSHTIHVAGVDQVSVAGRGNRPGPARPVRRIHLVIAVGIVELGQYVRIQQPFLGFPQGRLGQVFSSWVGPSDDPLERERLQRHHHAVEHHAADHQTEEEIFGRKAEAGDAAMFG